MHCFFSETEGASQYFVEQTDEELKHLNLTVQALHDFKNCSQSLSGNSTDVLKTCYFEKLGHLCQPQYIVAVMCAPKQPSSNESKHVLSFLPRSVIYFTLWIVEKSMYNVMFPYCIMYMCTRIFNFEAELMIFFFLHRENIFIPVYAGYPSGVIVCDDAAVVLEGGLCLQSKTWC